MTKSVCVFCGSAPGARPSYSRAAEDLGRAMAQRGITLVYGGGRLGLMGIVADANGFYHASSSKGITYSPFAGYWSNRIVGFRRLAPEVVNDNSRDQ